MAKRAALTVIHAGTVHPGKYLVLVGGGVADIEEALDAAHRLESSSLIDQMFLPDPHSQLVGALAGERSVGDGEALGVIETTSVSSVILAADAGLKGAGVVLREVYLADGLGGKGYLLFSGPLVEVQVAVELASERVSADLVGRRVIAQLHDEMNVNLIGDGQFSSRVRGA